GEPPHTSELSLRLQADWQRLEDRIRAMYEDKLDGLISPAYYQEKNEEYRGEQERIKHRLDALTQDGDQYYVSAASLLQLAARADYLFAVSEPVQKRLLLQTVL